VTKLGGTSVRDAADLGTGIALLRVGEVAEFAVSRKGDMLTPCVRRWRNVRRPRG
jgi:hypothetical protein